MPTGNVLVVISGSTAMTARDTTPNHVGLIGESSATTNSGYMQGFGVSDTSCGQKAQQRSAHNEAE